MAVTRLIPLYRRGNVVAHALVDAVDFDRLNAYRWRLHSDGYAMRMRTGEDGKLWGLRMHREVLGLKYRERREVDHRNLNKLDNRRSNLRIVTRSEQMQNLPAHRNSTSPYRGVCWHKGARKWQAHVRVDNVQHYLGLFERQEDAAAATAAFRREHMPLATI